MMDSVFNKTLWLQNVRKIKSEVRYKTLLRHRWHYCIIFVLFNCKFSLKISVKYQMDKLVLSANEVLYLQKQLLVGTLQKYLFYKAMFFTKDVALHKIDSLTKYFCSFMITAANYFFRGTHLSKTLVWFILGKDLIISRH